MQCISRLTFYLSIFFSDSFIIPLPCLLSPQSRYFLENIQPQKGDLLPANYFYQLGLCYTFIGEYEKAIAICKKALHQNPNDLVGRITLAIAYISLGREEEARTEAAEVLRIHPKFSVEYASKTWPSKTRPIGILS